MFKPCCCRVELCQALLLLALGTLEVLSETEKPTSTATTVPISTTTDSGFNCLNFTNHKIFEIKITEDQNTEYNKEGIAGTVRCNIKPDCYKHDDYTQERAVKILSNVTLKSNSGKELAIQSRTNHGNNGYDFTIAWHFVHHHQKAFWCKSTMDGLEYKSEKLRINVEENITLNVFTAESVITAGNNYSLTCTANSATGLKDVKWSRTSLTSIEGEEKVLDCEKSKHYRCDNRVEGNKAILTMATASKDAGQKWHYICFSGHSLDRTKAMDPVTIEIKAKSKIGIIVPSVLAILIVIGAGIKVGIVCYRRKILADNIRASVLQSRFVTPLREVVNNDYEGNYNAGDDFQEIIERMSMKHAPWNCTREHISLKKVIGEGNFGEVMLGTMPTDLNILQHVAIKTIKQQSADIKTIIEFEKEIDVMASLRHKNIVNLLGICIDEWPFFIIMEYMENGPLNHFLYLHAPVNNPSSSDGHGPFTLEQLIYMCYQPCSALEYLASKNMVHRDVSARNCLVGQDLVVKLADFGLSRDTSDNAKHYYKKEGGMVPVKWMAPEALTYCKYTTANDVWAFGVLMWEIFSYGANPYSAFSNQQVMVYITKGGRLEQPDACSLELWQEVVVKCWTDSPDDRITFSALVAYLKNYLNPPE